MARHGRAWALATTYEMAFLHLVMAALENAPLEQRPCTALPFLKVKVQTLSEKSQAWLRAVNVLLLRAKCEDDVRDEGSLRARLGLKLSRHLDASSRAALEKSGFPLELITDLPRRQDEVERLKLSSLEQYALSTAELTGELFSHPATLTKRPELNGILRHLGQSVGYLLYWKDSFDDRASDTRAGRFNALLACSGESRLVDSWERENRRAEWAIESLPFDDAQREALLSCLSELHPTPRSAKPLLGSRERKRQAGLCDAVVGECLLQICCQCGGEVCSGFACDCCCIHGATSRERETSITSSAPPPAQTPRLPCPACSNNLRQKSYARVEVDECPACRGLWLDKGELQKLLDGKSLLPERFFKPVTLQPLPTRPEGTRPCPRCGLLLLSNLVSGVTIDICPDCAGIWLDQDELNLFLQQ